MAHFRVDVSGATNLPSKVFFHHINSCSIREEASSMSVNSGTFSMLKSASKSNRNSLNQMLARLNRLAEEYNVAVFLTNQVQSDPGASALFAAADGRKPYVRL